MRYGDPAFVARMGLRISQARTAAGMSRALMARELGYKSVQSVSRIERGGAELPMYLLPRVASLLGVPAVWLLGMTEDIPAPRTEADKLLEGLREQVAKLSADNQRLARQASVPLACQHCTDTEASREEERSAHARIRADLVKQIEDLAGLEYDDVPLSPPRGTRCKDPDCILTPDHWEPGARDLPATHYDGTRKYVRNP
jgi:transcriptional regulator with XRE-family HTH domain